MRVVGKEGARIAVTVATPKGYRAASTSNARWCCAASADIEGGAGHPLPIEHIVKFAPLQRQYAVLVRAGIAGIPVETFGTQQAVTNGKGVAIFLYEGTPGDELQVKLVTDGRPDLMPRNPTQSFLLATRSEAYLVKEHFTAIRKAGHRKPAHVGPSASDRSRGAASVWIRQPPQAARRRPDLLRRTPSARTAGGVDREGHKRLSAASTKTGGSNGDDRPQRGVASGYDRPRSRKGPTSS